MKSLILLISSAFMLVTVSCSNDSVAINPNESKIVARACVGDYTIHYLQKGKCKNDCQRGHSVNCNGGYTKKSECGQITTILGGCDESFGLAP